MRTVFCKTFVWRWSNAEHFMAPRAGQAVLIVATLLRQFLFLGKSLLSMRVFVRGWHPLSRQASRLRLRIMFDLKHISANSLLN
jgi:hypothetical protein